MRLTCLPLVCALVFGCSSVPYAELPNRYPGPDGGIVIVAFGASSRVPVSSFAMFFRRQGAAAEWDKRQVAGYFTPVQSWLSSAAADYQNVEEAGKVLLFSLTPGDYEIFAVGSDQGMGYVEIGASPDKRFSIPFTVRANTATYLGNYLAGDAIPESFPGVPMRFAAIYTISDRMQQDVAMARAKLQKVLASRNGTLPSNASAMPLAIPEAVVNATPDPKSLNLREFRRPGDLFGTTPVTR